MSLSEFRNGTAPECPGAFNLAQYVLAQAQKTPDKNALECISSKAAVRTFRYSDLRHAVMTMAAGLRTAGIGNRDRVVLRLGNDPIFPISFLALCALGAIPVVTSRALTAPEFRDVCDRVAPIAAIITDDPGVRDGVVLRADDPALTQSEPLTEFCATRSDDPAYVVFTSGSSGQPKAVVHAHRAVWARRMMWSDWYDLTSDDRMLHAGSFNWTFTLGTGLLDPWARGATALICVESPGREEWARVIEQHAPTLLAAAPGVLRQIAEADGGALAQAGPGLRHILCAGDGLPEPIRARVEAAFGVPVHTALGMSEVSTYVSTSPRQPHRTGTTGRPQTGRHVAVLRDTGDIAPLGEVGQLCVHASDPGLMLGYLAHDGTCHLPLIDGTWFATGDRAVMAEAGWITHLGRVDDLINAGGYRVSPVEIEAALSAHPAIREVAVTAVAIRDGVEVIAAFFEGEQITSEELAAFASGRLARYKQPRIFQAVPALPRKANGKLARNELQALWNSH